MVRSNNQVANFEDALDRLEKTISILQDGNLSLEESLKAFEEGISLIRVCQENLSEAESKVMLLLKDNNGNLSEAPFNIGVEE